MSDLQTEDLSEHYGQATAELVQRVFDAGADRAVLLMRHSAREFNRSIHDLLNPLTNHGRTLCENLGHALPKDVHVKGYASPPERCVETAQLIIDAHRQRGGEGSRTRPVEGLGVFYSLDQIKMWKFLQGSTGLADFVHRWFQGEVPEDTIMPPDVAVAMIMRVLHGKLVAPGSARQLDLCVSHDMTLFLVRHEVGLEPVTGPEVEFLDGLILFEQAGELRLASHHGGEVTVQM